MTSAALRADRAGRAEQRHASRHDALSAIGTTTSPAAPECRRRGRAPAISQASAAAPKSPSTRSSTPPWPGMIAAGILHAEAPLHRRFEEIAGLRGDRERRGEKKAGDDSRPPRSADASRPPATIAAASPVSAPDQVFFGETRGQSFGPPKRAPAEIGGDVGRPDDDEDEEDRQPSRTARPAAAAMKPAQGMAT